MPLKATPISTMPGSLMGVKAGRVQIESGSVPIASQKYVRELDGIRAIAVCIVVAAHYQLPYVPGGFGVTVFFFLSGYLILLRIQLDSDDQSDPILHASVAPTDAASGHIRHHWRGFLSDHPYGGRGPASAHR
jgi:hypothetical protein